MQIAPSNSRQFGHRGSGSMNPISGSLEWTIWEYETEILGA